MARLPSRVIAVLVGSVLAAMIADVPLALLAWQGLDASGGSVPVWVSAVCGLVGFVVAWRRPANPLGWILLAGTLCAAVSEDASYYAVAAALFNPVRRQVQRQVDRRFNRARYDADATVTAFAGRLQDAVNFERVRDDLAGTVDRALEPAHVSVWTVR